MSKAEPLVLIVSGPSGSGKSTLVEKILQLPGTMLSVSCTTRMPRKTESDGKWYNFVSEAQFQEMVERGDFLEYAQVFGKNWYGTPRKSLAEAETQKKDLVLEIDVQGALQVKAKLPGAVAVFVLPPSRMELEHRIRQRGQDSEDEIRRRLDRAAGIGRAADACAGAGFHEKGLEVALDMEQLLYEATTLLNAASLVKRIGQQS